MGANVRGTFLLTQLAVPYLIASKGNVVNVSSVASLRPFPGSVVYLFIVIISFGLLPKNKSLFSCDNFVRLIGLLLKAHF